MTGSKTYYNNASSMSINSASDATGGFDFAQGNQHAHAAASAPMHEEQHWRKTLSAQIDATQRRPSSTESSTASEQSFTACFEFEDGSANSATTNNISNNIRDSTDSSRSSADSDSSEIMWEARRARERAEQEAEQKLIDAVCKASLLEYNEKERAMQHYENELVARDFAYLSGSTKLQLERVEAEQRKRDAMQRVIDSKQKAQHMAARAREATGLYEQKNAERLAKSAELEEIRQQKERELALLAVQHRKEEAIRRREDAERRAQAAREKAEAMRTKAIQAVQVVRAQSRKQIETELTHEEDHRQLELQRKLQELELEKSVARDRKEAAARKAAEAQRRADALRLRAEQARQALQASAAAPATQQM